MLFFSFKYSYTTLVMLSLFSLSSTHENLGMEAFVGLAWSSSEQSGFARSGTTLHMRI